MPIGARTWCRYLHSGVCDRLVYEISDPLTGIVRYFDIPAQLMLDVGKYPELLSTKQTKRVQKLYLVGCVTELLLRP